MLPQQVVILVEMGDNSVSVNLLASGSAVCVCSKTEYRASQADLRDERTNKTDKDIIRFSCKSQ